MTNARIWNSGSGSSTRLLRHEVLGIGHEHYQTRWFGGVVTTFIGICSVETSDLRGPQVVHTAAPGTMKPHCSAVVSQKWPKYRRGKGQTVKQGSSFRCCPTALGRWIWAARTATSGRRAANTLERRGQSGVEVEL